MITNLTPDAVADCLDDVARTTQNEFQRVTLLYAAYLLRVRKWTENGTVSKKHAREWTLRGTLWNGPIAEDGFALRNGEVVRVREVIE